MREAVLAWKFHRDARALEFLARSVAERCVLPELWLRGKRGWVVTAVPSHFLRRWSRGHDAAWGLAREVARRAGIPCRRLLRRSRPTPPQTRLERTRRLRNVRGAFAPCRGRKPPRVVLVDDVVTTGATVLECAAVLKRCGVREILAVSAARSPAEGDS